MPSGVLEDEKTSLGARKAFSTGSIISRVSRLPPPVAKRRLSSQSSHPTHNLNDPAFIIMPGKTSESRWSWPASSIREKRPVHSMCLLNVFLLSGVNTARSPIHPYHPSARAGRRERNQPPRASRMPRSGISSHPPVLQSFRLISRLLELMFAIKYPPLWEKRRPPHHSKGASRLFTCWRSFQSQR
jgi:hypothetical protein